MSQMVLANNGGRHLPVSLLRAHRVEIWWRESLRWDSGRIRTSMNFIADYMKAIDILAVVAVIAIGAASFSRTGVVWLLGTAIVLAVWCASRIFGWFP